MIEIMCLKFEEYNNKHLKGMIKTGTATIQLTQSANGKSMKSILDKFLTAAISVATTGIVGCCVFIWRSNASLSQIEEHLQNIDKRMDNHELKIDNIQVNMADAKERLIRIETLQKH